ncbi:MAG: hypothetical protein QOJ63_1694 [Solirubrobacteraceae bacterium]|nr:hypothetical protein [Solirubrobacteraceae bacterium]
MPRILPAAALAAACALASPNGAGAVTVVAPGPDGRALLVRSSDAGMQLVERDAAGRLRPARTLAPATVYPALAAWGPSGSALVLATDQLRDGPYTLLMLRRASGAERFGAPATLARATPIQVLSAEADERGNVAVLVRTDLRRTALLTAVRGGALGPPQELDIGTADAAVAVGGGGRVLLTWYDAARHGVYARTGTIGSALGAPQPLAADAPFTDVVAAVDDAGNATVAFVLPDRRRRFGPSALVAARARPDRRFGSPAVLGLGGPAQMGAGFASLDAAAAGTTTAVTWDPNDSVDTKPFGGRLGVAVARGGGRFGPAAAPSAPTVLSTGRRGLFGQPAGPSVAVDRAGDVLLAYEYGYAVHASLRPARSTRFGPPRAISSLARNGGPVAALLRDRRPLVACEGFDGVTGIATRLGARRPDLTPPRISVRLRRDAAAQLRDDNAVEVRAGCSQACLVEARATLRTPTGRTILYEGASTALPRGATFTKRFVFDPTRPSGRAGDGARVRITIIAGNASGASRQAVRQLELKPEPG